MALLDVDAWAVRNWLTLVSCSRCGAGDESVQLHTAATAYHDPALNQPVLLCCTCAEEYYAYWESQWAEYNASRR